MNSKIIKQEILLLGKIAVIFAGFQLQYHILNAQIYVSPEGNDTSSGTISNPLKTVQKAMSIVPSGDIIYLRGGLYSFTSTQSTVVSGTQDTYCRLWAYPDENPILDFSGQPYGSSSRGILISKNFWHVRGVTIRYAGDNGMYVSGQNNIIENCTFYGNKDSGLQVDNGGTNNTIRYCDSYLNYDPPNHGENADGFAIKTNSGPGNIFIGCRAWSNSDDGWDCWEAKNKIIIDSCWAFRNGINIWNDTSFQGDGNGFKMGGNYIAGPHLVMRSVSFDNQYRGFDQNNNTAGITVYNCTAWRNSENYRFSKVPTTGKDTLKNNISLAAGNTIEANAVLAANSWQGLTVSTADFLSLDTSLARILRQTDGRIPATGFFRLAASSSLVNAGVDIGLPFKGSAPDLGAFESDVVGAVAASVTEPREFLVLENYPNPFNPATTICFSADRSGAARLDIKNILGERVCELFKGEVEAGKVYEIKFNGAQLPAGIYFGFLETNGRSAVHKILLVK